MLTTFMLRVENTLVPGSSIGVLTIDSVLYTILGAESVGNSQTRLLVADPDGTKILLDDHHYCPQVIVSPMYDFLVGLDSHGYEPGLQFYIDRYRTRLVWKDQILFDENSAAYVQIIPNAGNVRDILRQMERSQNEKTKHT